MKNQPPVLVPAVVALHIQNEPDLKLNDVCLTVHDSSKDGGIEATLARPKTTLKKTYAAHVQCGKFIFVSVWATSMTSCFVDSERGGMREWHRVFRRRRRVGDRRDELRDGDDGDTRLW